MKVDRLNEFIGKACRETPDANFSPFFLKLYTGASWGEIQDLVERGILVEEKDKKGGIYFVLGKNIDEVSSSPQIQKPHPDTSLLYRGRSSIRPLGLGMARRAPKFPDCDHLPANFPKKKGR